MSRAHWYPTDEKWFHFLRERQRSPEGVDEVNFWKPKGGSFATIHRGDPFLFKLKAPVNAIGGFGFFEHFEKLPLALAWDAFGKDNGAPDLATLDQMIRKHRGEKVYEPLPLYEIGCIMLSGPVFLDDRDFVTNSATWRIQGPVQGAAFDISEGDGKRVWEDCRARATAEGWQVPPDQSEIVKEAPRFGAPRLVAPRRGQKTFQLVVAAAYGKACAVSGEHSWPALETAHIKSYSDGGSHETSNGILLRSDIHRLFDAGMVTITPDYQFRVSSRLQTDFRNGRTYYDLEARLRHEGGIRLPKSVSDYPSRELLDRHGQERFIA